MICVFKHSQHIHLSILPFVLHKFLFLQCFSFVLNVDSMDICLINVQDPTYRMPDFKMSGKKSDELEPTDAGDEDDGGDDDDEDGDFGEG